MKRLCSWAGFVFLLALGLVPMQGQGGYFRVSGTELLEDSHLIFVGELLDKESFWSQDGRFILTRHIFEVKESLKGQPGGRTEIIEYGGTVGDRTMTVSHVASYSPGREYLVFSYPDELHQNRTLAGPQGRLPVMSDKNGRRSVRVYSSHPLMSVLGGEAGKNLQDLGPFSTRLRSALANTTSSEK